MPAIKCAKCGGLTNTAVSDHLGRKDHKANKCYIKVERGVWVKGCGYDDADPVYDKPSLDKYLGKSASSPKGREKLELGD